MTGSTADELFDVVDEHDNVVEVLSRGEVHRRKLRHRAVHIFLFRSDGRLLIHLRSANKEEFPSVWTSSASGHVASGEGYRLSAERELQEELGITAKLTFVAKFDACPETSNEFTELYTAVSDARVAADPGEIVDVRWATVAEIRSELQAAPEQFSPAFRLLFEFFANQTGQIPPSNLD
ncbi:MAG: NUDIX domain-containing protein [Planctomycetaceae bacterium]